MLAPDLPPAPLFKCRRNVPPLGRRAGGREPDKSLQREGIPYHNSKCIGSLTSTAMRGRLTVRRPVLILLRKLIPVRAAITMMLRPCGRKCDPESAGCWSAKLLCKPKDGSDAACPCIRSSTGTTPFEAGGSSCIVTCVSNILQEFSGK